jgi:hypothetical protein
MMVGMALVLVGLAALVGAALFVRRAIHERGSMPGWPSTQGLVRRSGVVPVQQMGALGTRILRFEARYEYLVGEKRMRGLLYSNVRHNHAALKAKYPPGAVVTVFYDPDHPGRSDLREKLGSFGGVTPASLAFFLFAVGGALLALGLMLP